MQGWLAGLPESGNLIRARAEPVIQSILDNDLYKFTMQQAVVELYPAVRATYEFINRPPSERFNQEFFGALRESIREMSRLRLQPDERSFLKQQCPYLKPAYLDYLENYRYDPGQVEARLDDRGGLAIEIDGPWHRAILWEVPLLALVSELYGRHVQTNWTSDGQAEKIAAKSSTLRRAGCVFADFGTRRRRSYATQDLVVGVLCDNPGFVGTSNVHLAQVHGQKPIGTMAHEWIMAHSVLCGLRHANRFALEAWCRVYNAQLGIALTDTYTTRAFFDDFDAYYARLYDGVRQDSGCPFEFTDLAVEHYDRLRIDPAAKTIVFSDGLSPELAARLSAHCGGRIRCSFGIGTNLTNDFEGCPAPNIVIKLTSVNGIPAVKLTDDPAKATGQPDALRVARWTILGMPLDGQQ
jgi:nicotinate phosphoribosyltransferase